MIGFIKFGLAMAVIDTDFLVFHGYCELPCILVREFRWAEFSAI